MNAHIHSSDRTRGGDRVRRHTSPDVRHQIDVSIEKSIRYHAGQPVDVISRRIRALEQEWDIERTLETNASALSLGGLVLAMLGPRRWLALPLIVQSFLLLHAVQGWCPPLPLFRRAGVRTRQEIERERYALKTLRGDFDHLRRPRREEDPAGTAMEAVGG